RVCSRNRNYLAMSSLEWKRAQLEALENDNFEPARTQKIDLANSISEQMEILAEECERRGQSGEELKRCATEFTDFAHQEAQALQEHRRTQALADWLVHGKSYTPST